MADRRPGIVLTAVGIALIGLVLLALPYTRHKMHRLVEKALSLPPRPTYARLAVGDSYTPLLMQPVQGNDGLIRHTRGRPLLINVFTTWCPGCKDETPALSQFSRQFADRVDIVGIDQEESPAIIQPFEERYGLKYPIFIDQNHITEKVLSARFIPTTMLVGANNKVLTIHHGPLSYKDFVSMVKPVGHPSI